MLSLCQCDTTTRRFSYLEWETSCSSWGSNRTQRQRWHWLVTSVNSSYSL